MTSACSVRFDRAVAMRIGDDAPRERQLTNLRDRLITARVEHINGIGAPAGDQQLCAVGRKTEVPATLTDRHVGKMLVALAVEYLHRLVACRRDEKPLAVGTVGDAVRTQFGIDG